MVTISFVDQRSTRGTPNGASGYVRERTLIRPAGIAEAGGEADAGQLEGVTSSLKA
jgi:hypothetical protein